MIVNEDSGPAGFAQFPHRGGVTDLMQDRQIVFILRTFQRIGDRFRSVERGKKAIRILCLFRIAAVPAYWLTKRMRGMNEISVRTGVKEK